MSWGKKKSGKSSGKYRSTKTKDKYGEVIDSKFEARAKEAFERAGFKFEFQKRIQLQDTFKPDHGKTVRLISIKPDFFFPDYNGVDLYVDTKGVSDDATCLRWKMLENKLFKRGDNYSTIWLRTDEDVLHFISLMKKGRSVNGCGKKDY